MRAKLTYLKLTFNDLAKIAENCGPATIVQQKVESEIKREWNHEAISKSAEIQVQKMAGIIDYD